MNNLRLAILCWCAGTGGMTLSGVIWALLIKVAFTLEMPVNLKATFAALVVTGFVIGIAMAIILRRGDQ